MLVTLAEMKTYLNELTGTYDAFLTQQITLVSQAIEAYCRRNFLRATYTQTFYRQDYGEMIRLFQTYQFPVSSVTSIVYDATTENPSGTTLTEYRLHKGSGMITPGVGFYYCDKAVIVYAAGYLAAELPEPIRDVVFSIVSERYNKKKAGIDLNFGTDVQRVSIPGTISIDYDYSLTNNDRSTAFGQILGSYLNVLDFYRSERAIVGSGTLEYVE